MLIQVFFISVEQHFAEKAPEVFQCMFIYFDIVHCFSYAGHNDSAYTSRDGVEVQGSKATFSYTAR